MGLMKEGNNLRERSWTLLMVVIAVILLVVAFNQPAQGEDLPTITVDGQTYEATKISGPTVHFETPDTNPTEAFTERHVWEGNGSDNLPCEGGIHWIDNNNVLTVSHCLEVATTTTTPTTTSSSTTSTTTSTTPPSTSSTLPATTTTTCESECQVEGCQEDESCDETEPTTTTSTEPALPTVVTSNPQSPAELPYTGQNEDLALLAIGLLALGIALVVAARKESNEV